MKAIFNPEKKVFWQSAFFVLVYIILAVFGAALISSPVADRFIQESRLWGWLSYVLIKAVAIIVAPISSTPLYVAAPGVFGPARAYWLSVMGDAIGVIGAFALGRRYGWKIIQVLFLPDQQSRLRGLLHYIEKPSHLFLARFVLLPFADLLTYAASLSKIRFTAFVAASLAGIIIFDAAVILFSNRFVDTLADYIIILCAVGCLSLLLAKSYAMVKKRFLLP